MAYAFDTLGYAKRLRDAGIPPDEAEADAEAAREFIMTELVTKQDLLLTTQALEARFDVIDARFGTVDVRFRGVETAMQNLELRLQNRIDSPELRLMVRPGGMLAVAVAILAAIIKF